MKLAILALASILNMGCLPSVGLVFHEGQELWTMDADGGNPFQVTHGPPRTWEHVAVSTSGAMLAATATDGGAAHIWLVNISSGFQTRLLPTWAVDGDGGVDFDLTGKLYFVGKQTGAETYKDLYKVNIDGTGLVRLTNTASEDECDPSVDRTTGLVFYCKVVFTPSPHLEIWSITLDGASPTQRYIGGEPLVASVHDPEALGNWLVYSQVDCPVPPTPCVPVISGRPDTVPQNIWLQDLTSGARTKLTASGQVSILPDLDALGRVVFTDIRAASAGTSLVYQNGGASQTPVPIRANGTGAKWRQ